MTNSESLGAESATEPTTKPEQDALNMSAGAEMLIERMKTNPDDFTYGGRFYKVRNVLEQEHAASGWISPRDFEALLEAYGRLILEPQFTEWVYNEIFNPKEEEQIHHGSYAAMQGQKLQMQNAMLQGTWIDSRALYGSPLQGAALWNGAVPPNTALEVSNTNPTGIFTSMKNKLGL